MVAHAQVIASNAQIASSLPPNLVAAFVGATSGIGEAALKEFVRQAKKPKCYFVGRSEQSANRIIEECKTFNPDADIVFMRADLSLVKEAERLCEEIKSRERAINFLFLSAGEASFDRSGMLTLKLFLLQSIALLQALSRPTRCSLPLFSLIDSSTETSEGLHTLTALTVYSRFCITLLLLPLLQRSTHLSRVVNIAGGCKEGSIYPSDFQALAVPLYAIRGHLATLISLNHEALAARAPDVSFIQVFPGAVKTALFDRMSGLLRVVMRAFINLTGKWLSVPIQESGERNVFFSTSAGFPARDGAGKDGVSLVEGVGVTRGTDGKIGSGVYSVDYDGTEAGQKVIDLLERYRTEGMVERVGKHVQAEIERITGTELRWD